MTQKAPGRSDRHGISVMELFQMFPMRQRPVSGWKTSGGLKASATAPTAAR